MNTSTKKTMNSKNVVQLTGITYRQLDYWVNSTQYLAPQCTAIGTGYSRKFEIEDVIVINALAQVYKMMRLMGGGEAVGLHHNVIDAMSMGLYPYAEVAAAQGATQAWMVWSVGDQIRIVFALEDHLFTPDSGQLVLNLKPHTDKVLDWFGVAA